MAIYRMFRMQCGENSTQTAHTFVHITHTPGGPRFAHINGPLGEDTQSATGARTGFRCAEQREGDSAVDHRGRMHAESPAIEVDTSLGEFRVRRVLDRIALERRLLEAIVLDNGPFFGRNHLQFASRLRLRAHRPRCAFTTPTRREQASPS